MFGIADRNRSFSPGRSREVIWRSYGGFYWPNL